jgi:PEP-CTERM motif
MKNQFKSALIAIAIAGAATVSQAATYNGDLIIGFTLQSGNDMEYDLGSAASLVDGEAWNLSSLLGTLNSSTVKWGVIGDTTTGTPKNVWATKAVGSPNPLNGNAAWSPINSPTVGIYSLFPAAGAGQSVAPSSTLANSWNQQTIAGAGSTYKNNYMNPNTAGYTSVNFYKTVTDNSVAQLLGTFSFADTGIVTFSAVAVPEPASYGALAGLGLLALSVRRHVLRKA